jgi:hypothetical protein
LVGTQIVESDVGISLLTAVQESALDRADAMGTRLDVAPPFVAKFEIDYYNGLARVWYGFQQGLLARFRINVGVNWIRFSVLNPMCYFAV